MDKYINLEKGLDFTAGDRELFTELLESFLNENKFDKDATLRLITNGNYSEAATIIHRTKGAAFQTGADILGNQGQILEDILRNKTDGDVKKEFEHFCNIYKATYAEMEKIVKTIH